MSPLPRSVLARAPDDDSTVIRKKRRLVEVLIQAYEQQLQETLRAQHVSTGTRTTSAQVQGAADEALPATLPIPDPASTGHAHQTTLRAPVFAVPKKRPPPSLLPLAPNGSLAQSQQQPTQALQGPPAAAGTQEGGSAKGSAQPRRLPTVASLDSGSAGLAPSGQRSGSVSVAAILNDLRQGAPSYRCQDRPPHDTTQPSSNQQAPSDATGTAQQSAQHADEPAVDVPEVPRPEAQLPASIAAEPCGASGHAHSGSVAGGSGQQVAEAVVAQGPCGRVPSGARSGDAADVSPGAKDGAEAAEHAHSADQHHAPSPHIADQQRASASAGAPGSHSGADAGAADAAALAAGVAQGGCDTQARSLGSGGFKIPSGQQAIPFPLLRSSDNSSIPSSREPSHDSGPQPSANRHSNYGSWPSSAGPPYASYTTSSGAYNLSSVAQGGSGSGSGAGVGPASGSGGLPPAPLLPLSAAARGQLRPALASHAAGVPPAATVAAGPAGVALVHSGGQAASVSDAAAAADTAAAAAGALSAYSTDVVSDTPRQSARTGAPQGTPRQAAGANIAQPSLGSPDCIPETPQDVAGIDMVPETNLDLLPVRFLWQSQGRLQAGSGAGSAQGSHDAGAPAPPRLPQPLVAGDVPAQRPVQAAGASGAVAAVQPDQPDQLGPTHQSTPAQAAAQAADIDVVEMLSEDDAAVPAAAAAAAAAAAPAVEHEVVVILDSPVAQPVRRPLRPACRVTAPRRQQPAAQPAQPPRVAADAAGQVQAQADAPAPAQQAAAGQQQQPQQQQPQQDAAAAAQQPQGDGWQTRKRRSRTPSPGPAAAPADAAPRAQEPRRASGADLTALLGAPLQAPECEAANTAFVKPMQPRRGSGGSVGSRGAAGAARGRRHSGPGVAAAGRMSGGAANSGTGGGIGRAAPLDDDLDEIVCSLDTPNTGLKNQSRGPSPNNSLARKLPCLRAHQQTSPQLAQPQLQLQPRSAAVSPCNGVQPLLLKRLSGGLVRVPLVEEGLTSPESDSEAGRVRLDRGQQPAPDTSPSDDRPYTTPDVNNGLRVPKRSKRQRDSNSGAAAVDQPCVQLHPAASGAAACVPTLSEPGVNALATVAAAAAVLPAASAATAQSASTAAAEAAAEAPATAATACTVPASAGTTQLLPTFVIPEAQPLTNITNMPQSGTARIGTASALLGADAVALCAAATEPASAQQVTGLTAGTAADGSMYGTLLSTYRNTEPLVMGRGEATVHTPVLQSAQQAPQTALRPVEASSPSPLAALGTAAEFSLQPATLALEPPAAIPLQPASPFIAAGTAAVAAGGGATAEQLQLAVGSEPDAAAFIPPRRLWLDAAAPAAAPDANEGLHAPAPGCPQPAASQPPATEVVSEPIQGLQQLPGRPWLLCPSPCSSLVAAVVPAVNASTSCVSDRRRRSTKAAAQHQVHFIQPPSGELLTDADTASCSAHIAAPLPVQPSTSVPLGAMRTPLAVVRPHICDELCRLDCSMGIQSLGSRRPSCSHLPQPAGLDPADQGQANPAEAPQELLVFLSAALQSPGLGSKAAQSEVRLLLWDQRGAASGLAGVASPAAAEAAGCDGSQPEAAGRWKHLHTLETTSAVHALLACGDGTSLMGAGADGRAFIWNLRYQRSPLSATTAADSLRALQSEGEEDTQRRSGGSQQPSQRGDGSAAGSAGLYVDVCACHRLPQATIDNTPVKDIVCLHSLPSQPHLVVATSSDSAVVVWDTLHRHCLYTTRLTTHTPSPQSSLLYNSFPVDLHDVLHTRMHQQTLQQLRDGLQHADGPQTGVRGGAVLACEDGDKHDGGRWVVGANGLLDTRTPGPGQRHTETALRTRLLTGLATQAIGETPVVKVLVGGAPGTVCRTGPASGAGVGRGGVGVGATLLRPQGQRGSGSSDATGPNGGALVAKTPMCFPIARDPLTDGWSTGGGWTGGLGGWTGGWEPDSCCSTGKTRRAHIVTVSWKPQLLTVEQPLMMVSFASHTNNTQTHSAANTADGATADGSARVQAMGEAHGEMVIHMLCKDHPPVTAPSLPLGAAVAGAAVSGGCAVVLLRRGGKESVIVQDLLTGRVAWGASHDGRATDADRQGESSDGIAVCAAANPVFVRPSLACVPCSAGVVFLHLSEQF